MRSLAKSILRAIALAVVLPAVALAWMQGKLLGSDQVFPGWAQLFSLAPGMTGEYLRYAFYRCLAAQCEDDVCISFGTVACHPGIRLGQSAYIGNYCSLGNVTIEKDALIASHVSVMNGCRQHGTSRLDIPIRLQPGEYEPVTIGEGAWIGEHATVAATVGRHCIVGAGALVLQPIPDFAIAVGSPARVIGDRRDSATTEAESVSVQEPAVLC